MKKWMYTFLSLLPLVVYGYNVESWSNKNTSLPLSISAQCAVLMDADSQRVLINKNADHPRLIASLTKIMTAIIAIEYGNLDELVKISPKAVGVEGSSIYLKLGEKIPLRTLLYGLMLRSGNDAAVAIAEHIGGSVNGFVYLMNEKVEHLGLKNTHFMNPHGLDHPKHYSSARDLALITAHGMKLPFFREVVKTKEKRVDWPGEKWDRIFHNKNKMLRLYSGADGVKTGFTKKAHRTLVSSATRNGVQLIAVTLNDGNDWKDCMDMFDYGFKQYGSTALIKKGHIITTTTAGNSSFHVVTSSSFPYGIMQEKQVILEPVFTRLLKDVNDEIPVGVARVYDGYRLIGYIPLETKRVRIPTLLSRWKKILGYTLGHEVTP